MLFFRSFLQFDKVFWILILFLNVLEVHLCLVLDGHIEEFSIAAFTFGVQKTIPSFSYTRDELVLSNQSRLLQFKRLVHRKQLFCFIIFSKISKIADNPKTIIYVRILLW